LLLQVVAQVVQAVVRVVAVRVVIELQHFLYLLESVTQ
jgi:hypothetical protein